MCSVVIDLFFDISLFPFNWVYQPKVGMDHRYVSVLVVINYYIPER